jgi:hypothetical protein
MEILAWAGAWIGLFVLIYGIGLALGRIGSADEWFEQVLVDHARSLQHLPRPERERAAHRISLAVDCTFAAGGATATLLVAWLQFGS